MRTESELFAALATREHLAPTADRVLAGLDTVGARRRRRRAIGAVAVAALAVATVAVTPAGLARLDQDAVPAGSPEDATTDPHAADRPLWSLTIAAGAAAGYEIRPSYASFPPAQQGAVIVPVGGDQAVAWLDVYAEPMVGLGSADDNEIDDIRAGDVAALVHDQPAILNPEDGSLRWRYAPQAWAWLTSSPDGPPLPPQTLLKIASAVRFVDPYPLRVPFRLDDVPADLRPFHVSAHPGGEATVQFDSPDPEAAAERGAAITVTLGVPGWPGYDGWPWAPATVADRPGRCAEPGDRRWCEVYLGDVAVLVGSDAPAEIDALLAGLHLADLDDPATWFAAEDAIPNATSG